MKTYYKALTASGLGPYSDFEWPLPPAAAPGEWVEVEGEIVPCQRGIHACTRQQVIPWLNERLFVIEFDGDVIDTGDKHVGRRARLMHELESWNATSARLFAADCAERVLHLYTPSGDSSWQPRDAISAARRHAAGLISDAGLGAARAATAPAAGAVAGAAARAAARAAAAPAAGAVAGAAARAAARAAAGAVAGAAARAAARAAAGDAAGAAARAAAWAAAGDAERAWQTNRLFEYLDGEIDVAAALEAIRGNAE